MPRKFRLNPRPYKQLRIATLFLLLYSFSFYFVELQGIYGYLALIVSAFLILAFGSYVNKAFSQMSEEYSLISKIFPILIIGLLIYVISTFLVKLFPILFISEYIGIVLVLGYLLEFAVEIMRLGNAFGRREIKISSYVLFAALISFVILGVIPYSFLLTLSSVLLYLGINNILYYINKEYK